MVAPRDTARENSLAPVHEMLIHLQCNGHMQFLEEVNVNEVAQVNGKLHLKTMGNEQQ